MGLDTRITKVENMEIIGYLGGMLLALCALPEAVRTIQEKHCHISWGMLLMWASGEILMLTYSTKYWDWSLMGNYGFNLIIISPMLYFKIKEYVKKCGPKS